MGSSSKQKTNSNQKTTTTPTFTGQGQSVLNSLSSDYLRSSNGDLGKASDSAATYLKSLMGTTNPYTEQTVSAMEAQAPREYASNLKQVRTAGYRGGAGSDYINQAGLASDFANALALNVANTRLNQFNTDRSSSLEAANSLGSLGTSNDALGLSLLNSLRGETSDTTAQSKTKGSSTDYGKVAAGVGTVIAVAI